MAKERSLATNAIVVALVWEKILQSEVRWDESEENEEVLELEPLYAAGIMYKSVSSVLQK